MGSEMIHSEYVIAVLRHIHWCSNPSEQLQLINQFHRNQAEQREAEMIGQTNAFHKTIAVLAATILIIASPQIFAQPTGCPTGAVSMGLAG